MTKSQIRSKIKQGFMLLANGSEADLTYSIDKFSIELYPDFSEIHITVQKDDISEYDSVSKDENNLEEAIIKILKLTQKIENSSTNIDDELDEVLKFDK